MSRIQHDPERNPWFVLPLIVITVVFAYLTVNVVEQVANHVPVNAQVKR